MSSGLTNNRHLDLEIFTKLKGSDLYNVCIVSKYENSLCRSEDFWRRKIRTDFSGLASFKLDDISNKDYYWFMVSNPVIMLSLLVVTSNDQGALLTMLYIFRTLSDERKLYELAYYFYRLRYGKIKDTHYGKIEDTDEEYEMNMTRLPLKWS